MLIKTTKGMYKVEKNYRDAFKLEDFQNKYLEEYYDKYPYIVGDISSEILRLKGFDDNPKSLNYYGLIDKYIEESCAFGCPHYILSRIHSEKEFEELYKKDKEPITTDERFVITPVVKENFDKESLVLQSSPKTKSNIIIDSQKMNKIPEGYLPKDILESVEKESSFNNQKRKETKKEEEDMQTYVSASPDFDPSKKEKGKNFNKFNSYNNNNNKNKNKNRNKNRGN